MKHWFKKQENSGIFLTENYNQVDFGVLSILPNDNGTFEFIEACDGVNLLIKTREDAIEALQEAIEYIKAYK